MAAIQKIRSYGAALIAVVGLALFAFIAEELVRAVSSTRNGDRQTIGHVYGESINYQEFNELYAQYENAVKLTNGGQTLNEQQATQLRDQVWNDLVTTKIFEHECEELGLQVTDAELQNIINTGASPVLSQTPFVNPQTGAFDANQLKQFLTQYQEMKGNPDYAASMEQMTMYYDYWKFIEKQVRQQALTTKYQVLLSSCILSNPISAKASFDARTNESSALVAAVSIESIKDEDVQVSEADIKAKYNDMLKKTPELFQNDQETRNIKFIAVPVTASQADEQALSAELEEYIQAMANGEAVANVVRESRSVISYNGVAVKRSSLPSDIAAEIDSLQPGTVKGPYKNLSDNTLNVVNYISKTSQPDSIEYRVISVSGTDEAAKKSADSIYNALLAGANMDTIAKKYNQPATKTWLTSASVDGSTMREDDRTFVTNLFTMGTNEYKKMDITNGTIIMQVTDRRNVVEKYNVAVIKRAIDFSDETHNEVWNKFSSFLAANTTQEDIEAKAVKAGYNVTSSNGIASNSHYVNNIASTTEALRWIFNKDTKVGDVSSLYECGNNNDVLLVVMLTGIDKKGTITLENEELKNYISQQALKDKKAEKIMEQMKNVKNIADASKIAGAVTDTISHITFASPVYVARVGAMEPALSGAVSATAKDQFKTPVRGNAAVYAFQVLDKSKNSEAKFDKKVEEQQLVSSYMGGLQSFMQHLAKKANIEDNRYLFFQ